MQYSRNNIFTCNKRCMKYSSHPINGVDVSFKNSLIHFLLAKHRIRYLAYRRTPSKSTSFAQFLCILVTRRVIQGGSISEKISTAHLAYEFPRFHSRMFNRRQFL